MGDTKPTRAASTAVLKFYEHSYDLVEGRRRCKVCSVTQGETASGHERDCWVELALIEATAIVVLIDG